MIRTLALLAAFSIPASAAPFGAEEASVHGAAGFQQALAGARTLAQGFKPAAAARPSFGIMALPGAGEFERYLREHSQLPARDALVAAGSPVAQVDLGRLLNKQWKTPATYSMGGQTVYIGGAFDRGQNAYVSAYVDGWAAPRFFNIKGLLESEGELKVGAVSYSVTLSANVLKPMKSQIVFENKADENEQARISVKKLLDSLHAAGETVALSDQSYQVFYYSDVVDGPGGPRLDANSKTYAFILMEGEDMHVFLIPAELVPASQVAVFKMYKDKRVGLQAAGGALKVFENP